MRHVPRWVEPELVRGRSVPGKYISVHVGTTRGVTWSIDHIVILQTSYDFGRRALCLCELFYFCVMYYV